MSKAPLLVLLALSASAFVHAADATVDGEGFVRDWLMLAPFTIPDDAGAAEIDLAQISMEGSLTPKAGDKQKIGDKEQTWKAVTAKEYNLNFNTTLGNQNEDVLGYLVAYVVADQERAGLTAAISSNDQGKVWLNGKEIYKFTETRGIDKDTDKVAGVTLKAGVNVVVFKVINQKNDWAAALRFLDKDGKAVTGLVVKSAP